MHMKHLLLAIAMLATPMAAAAQDQPPPWRDALDRQLMKEQQCRVMYLTNVKEREDGGRATVELRAHCEDGRAFDAKRLDRGLKFDIEECGPVVC
jgi:hypothetical protein